MLNACILKLKYFKRGVGSIELENHKIFIELPPTPHPVSFATWDQDVSMGRGLSPCPQAWIFQPEHYPLMEPPPNLPHPQLPGENLSAVFPEVTKAFQLHQGPCWQLRFPWDMRIGGSH